MNYKTRLFENEGCLSTPGLLHRTSFMVYSYQAKYLFCVSQLQAQAALMWYILIRTVPVPQSKEDTVTVLLYSVTVLTDSTVFELSVIMKLN